MRKSTGSFKPFHQWKKELQSKGEWEERSVKRGKPKSSGGRSKPAPAVKHSAYCPHCGSKR